MSKLIKVLAVMVTMVVITGCSAGVRYDSRGEVESYVKTAKLSVET